MLAPAIASSNLPSPTVLSPNLEAHLSQVIQQHLQQSRALTTSTDEALNLLDQAWETQKLLWQLRQQSIA